jgi:hypothetical protein
LNSDAGLFPFYDVERSSLDVDEISLFLQRLDDVVEPTSEVLPEGEKNNMPCYSRFLVRFKLKIVKT